MKLTLLAVSLSIIGMNREGARHHSSLLLDHGLLRRLDAMRQMQGGLNHNGLVH